MWPPSGTGVQVYLPDDSEVVEGVVIDSVSDVKERKMIGPTTKYLEGESV